MPIPSRVQCPFLMLALALSTALAPRSSIANELPPTLGEEWSRLMTILATGELDGTAGLEILAAVAGDIVIVDAVTGDTEDILDASWPASAGPVAWVADVDHDGDQEILLTLSSAPRIGFFDHDGVKYQEIWDAPNRVAQIVEFAQITGTSDLEIVVDTDILVVYEAATGNPLYDSLESLGGLSVISFEVADYNGDGFAQVLAEFNGVPNYYLIGDPNPVAVDGPLEGTSLPMRLASRPNPSMGPVQLQFTLQESGSTRVRIFDSTGRLVRSLVHAELSRGSHSVVWDGRDHAGRPVAPGLYHYEVESNGSRGARKILQLR